MSDKKSLTICKLPMKNDEREIKRQYYKPDKIKYLIIGESVPFNGTFFYYKNSNLYDVTIQVFKEIYDNINDTNFLDKFCEMGFYLDDLCEEPVNQYINEYEYIRIAKRKLYETDLANKIKFPSIQLIIIVMKGIEENVRNAMKIAKINKCYHTLPFPHPKNATNIKKYKTILRGLLMTIKIESGDANE